MILAVIYGFPNGKGVMDGVVSELMWPFEVMGHEESRFFEPSSNDPRGNARMCTELTFLTRCEVHLVVTNAHLTSCRQVAKTLRSSDYRESDARRGRPTEFFWTTVALLLRSQRYAFTDTNPRIPDPPLRRVSPQTMSRASEISAYKREKGQAQGRPKTC